MLFKNISFLQLWWPFCSAQPNHLCNFGRGHSKEHYCDIEFGPVVKEMQFKDFSYLELWWPPLFSREEQLCSFQPGCYEENFCEISLNLDQWYRRCLLKTFLSRALVAPLLSGVEPFVQFW